MTDFSATLTKAGLIHLEYGVTAVDAYYGFSMGSPVKFFIVEGGIVDMAKAFEKVDYPALPYADVSISTIDLGFEARVLCRDSILDEKPGATKLGSFMRNPLEGVYYDQTGMYEALRHRRFAASFLPEDNALFETALLLSRFPEDGNEESMPSLPLPSHASTLWQKDILTVILQGPGSSRAFELLRESGFIKKYWPCLADLLLVNHAKDCHPEGGGWSHTMEALRQRKTFDLTLSLAILLHDIGKAQSEAAEGRRFDKHAEIGAKVAERFLRSLGFSEAIVSDVHFLIRWHMLPAALPILPASKVEEIVSDRRFSTLLELYRCDEFSTFKGPDTYYAACAAYKMIVRNLKNPYRDVNGKKKSQSLSKIRS